MKCYIKYLDCKNNFTPTIKEFKTFEKARSWLLENFEKPDIDMINYY